MADEGAIVSGMAGRYATALFELAREQNAIDTVKVNLERFDAMVAEIADLARLLRSPVLSADEQKRALSGVLDKVGIDGIAANFLKLVATNRRLFAVLCCTLVLAAARSDRHSHVEVPQTSQFEVNERFRWPTDHVLLPAAGPVAGWNSPSPPPLTPVQPCP